MEHHHPSPEARVLLGEVPLAQQSLEGLHMSEQGIDSELRPVRPRVQDRELLLQPSEVFSELRNARLVDPVYQPLFALRDALSGLLRVPQVHTRRGLANLIQADMRKAIGPLGELHTSSHGLLAKRS